MALPHFKYCNTTYNNAPYYPFLLLRTEINMDQCT